MEKGSIQSRRSAAASPVRCQEWPGIFAGYVAISAMTALFCLREAPLISTLALVLGASATFFALSAVVGRSILGGRGTSDGPVCSSGEISTFNLAARRDVLGSQPGCASDERRGSSVERSSGLPAKREDTHASITQFRATVGVLVGQLAANVDRAALASNLLTEVVEGTRDRAASAIQSAKSCSVSTRGADIGSRTLGTSIKEIGSQVITVRAAVSDLTRVSEVTARTVDGLNNRVTQIGILVGVVQALSNEMNLLALNATIEAARAGEAGKGFAVVAQEVKSLASQTARSTERIAEHVSAIEKATVGVVEAVDAIGVTIRQADDLTSSIGAAIESQATIVESIESDCSKATVAAEYSVANIAELDSTFGTTGAAVKEALSAANDARAQTVELLKTTDVFLSRFRIQPALGAR
jgi:methyl-accepting chemotaxis protein